MIKVAICGANGRMGTTIAGLVMKAEDLEFIGGVDLHHGEVFGREVVSSTEITNFLTEKKPDVLVDFTIAGAAVENIRAAAECGVALVVGTTGFTDEQREANRRSIENRVPAVISSNFSIGVNIFWRLVREAAKQLGEYDVEVIEAHHRYKKDAPSGTAKTIIEVLKEELGDRETIYGREGMMERGNEIGVHVVRGGDIVGDHSVLFSGNHECIEISHRAYDRAVFAQGVVRSVRWVAGKKPGIYTMADVLGI